VFHKENASMKTYLAAGLSLALLAGAVVAANSIKSGPQVGEELAGPFHPLNINGEAAGKKNCLYCENGNNPVIMVFAREPNETVAKLIKKIDETTAKNTGCDMGSFVVFCSADKGLEKELTDLAKKLDLKKCVLAIDNPAGPEKYEVAKDADVTVVLYTKRTVKANHAFKKGELKDKDIDMIISDVSKIKPAK
jgi:hypothetical protein